MDAGCAELAEVLSGAPVLVLKDRALVARVMAECFPRLCEDSPLSCELLGMRMRKHLLECAITCAKLLDLLVRLHTVADVPLEHCVCVFIAFLHYCEACSTQLRKRIDEDDDVCAQCDRATCICVVQTPRLFLEAFDPFSTYSTYLSRVLMDAGNEPTMGRDNSFYRLHSNAMREFETKFYADCMLFNAGTVFSFYTVAKPSTFLPSEYKKCLNGFSALVDSVSTSVH